MAGSCRRRPTRRIPASCSASGSLGETGAAEFIIDRDGDDAMLATNADGMTALLRRVPMVRAHEPSR